MQTMHVQVAPAPVAGLKDPGSPIHIHEGRSWSGEGVENMLLRLKFLSEMVEPGFVPGDGGGKTVGVPSANPEVLQDVHQGNHGIWFVLIRLLDWSHEVLCIGAGINVVVNNLIDICLVVVFVRQTRQPLSSSPTAG